MVHDNTLAMPCALHTIIFIRLGSVFMMRDPEATLSSKEIESI